MHTGSTQASDFNLDEPRERGWLRLG